MIANDLKILKFNCYNERKEKIDEENRKGIGLILLFYSIIVLVNLVVHIAEHISFIEDPGFASEFVYMIIAAALYLFVFREKRHYATIGIYLTITPLMVITILHGTIWDTHQLTFTFLLLLLVLPLLILDKPWRVITLILSMTALFVVADCSCKDPEILGKDLLHVGNTCLISIAACLYTLIARIQSIESAGYYADKADLDPLTGLYNRFGAEERMEDNQPGLMVFLDLDHFKEVNDIFGHSEGDLVLKETAEALRSCFRKNDIIVRRGGDEFVVFAPGHWTRDQVGEKMSELLRKIENIRRAGENGEVKLSASIGCAYTTGGKAEMEVLMQRADEEMYKIKKSGKDGISIIDFDQSESES